MASDEVKMGKNNKESTDDDWERMIDNGSLDRAIEKLSMKNNSKSGVADTEKDLNEAGKVQVRLEEPPTRTPFTPMVRILKRETNPKSNVNNDLNNVNGTPAQKTPTTTKTFAQRQDEYARARARIMGSQSAAAIPNGNARTTNSTTLFDPSNNRHQERQQQQVFHKERRANGR